MKRLIAILMALLLVSACAYAQSTPSTQDNEELRKELEQLKKNMAVLEGRLAATEQKASQPAAAAPAASAETQQAAIAEIQANVKDLDKRVGGTERKAALDRINFTGDYRYEVHSIYEHIPDHFDGLQLQNALVRTIFCAQDPNCAGPGGSNLGKLALENTFSQQNFGQYQQFLNMLQQTNFTVGGATYRDGYAFLQAQVAGFQQQFGVAGFNAFQQALLQQIGVTRAAKFNNQALQTSRLRLDFNAKMTDNFKFTGRLSMYKAFGDSTGVQVFNGQPSSLNIDGTTAHVPNSDILRVERAYFDWNHILGSPVYLSIGRRPSTEGPPLNLRQDEVRQGTPIASVVDFQFDGITVGAHIGEKMVLRACYGSGYDSGFGNGRLPNGTSNGLSDTHFIGGNFDLYETDNTLVQATIARAFDVTDGFNGLTVFATNPLTGETGLPPAVLRFTASRNLGAIDLAGFLVQKHVGHFDVFGNVNWTGLRPVNVTGPFGGLGTDPFQVPTNHDGYLIYTGVRYTLPNNRTKIGFEFNHGSKYYLNFAQAQDDIIAPKTATRGNVYEAYITHRINPHFIVKGDYIRYDAQWSGSGFPTGAPHDLNGTGANTPVLGFPTFDSANKFAMSMIARF